MWLHNRPQAQTLLSDDNTVELHFQVVTLLPVCIQLNAVVRDQAVTSVIIYS